MATFKNGQRLGKLGNTTTYFLNGVLVTRTIGKSNKPPSQLQKAAWMRTSVISKFLKSISEFILVGYEQEALRLLQQPRNPAFSYNRKYGLTGSFPKIGIDFTKVLLSYGRMPVPEGVQIVVAEEGLIFNWALQEGLAGTHWSDQVMLMAYFPKLKKGCYITAGAPRYKGTDLLAIFDIERGTVGETYISFVANDRKSISNSIYTGKVTW